MIPWAPGASAFEMRLFFRRLETRAEDARLSEDEVDAIIAFAGQAHPKTLEQRARRLERLLTVASALLGSPTACAEWLRLPNSGLDGTVPLTALLSHEDALRAILAALIAEHRATVSEEYL